MNNWKLIRSNINEQVWVNKKLGLRLISAKGDKDWQVFYEKDIGKIASEESFISDAFIGNNLTKKEALKVAKKYMEDKQ
jgi:hypothetical protein